MQRISIWILVILVSTTASAATIRVGSGASADFSTIQAAVNAAESGDVIQVDQGSYREQIRIIGKDLTLVGTMTDTAGGLPAIVPTVLKPSGQFVNGREITALLLVKDAWVQLRDMRLGGVNPTVTERRKADILAAIAVLGATSGFDLRNSIVRNMNKGNQVTPRIVGFPTNCVGPLRNPDRGVGVLAIDNLSISVTNTEMVANSDGIVAACVADISIQGNAISATTQNNEEIGLSVGGNYARIVQNEFGQNYIDMLVLGNDSRIFQNSSRSASTIGIQIEGEGNILFGNNFDLTEEPLVDLGYDNRTQPPRGWRR